MASVQCLRAAVHQLTNTPTNDLPFIASYLTSTLADCGSLLSAPDKGGQDVLLLVQRLKARITSLLQDKTVEGRWTGVVLVKSVVESGQWEILRGCEQWVRGLLGILAKPDPPTAKKLCIITLTRIYMLTHRYQSLVREITTPTLPSFITACLNLVSWKPAQQEARRLKPNTKLLDPVLCSFINLLPSHATIFRTFSAQIHDLILPLLAPSQSSFPAPDSTVELAQRLFVSLHHCAPKNTAGDEWAKACRTTIFSLHRTASCLFRSVVEQWEPADPSVREVLRSPVSSGQVGDDGPDPLGLPAWTGINNGSQKIANLLKLLSQFILMRTSSKVAIPLGTILDLTSRLTSLTVPSPDVDIAAITNQEIGREEREGLWGAMPSIHAPTIDLLRTIIETFGVGGVSIVQSCLDQALWVFESESFCRAVRTATYSMVDSALPVVGFTLSKSDITSLTPTMRAFCRDLQAVDSGDAADHSKKLPSKQKSKTPNGTANADAFLNLGAKDSFDRASTGGTTGSEMTVTDLLCTFLSCVPVDLIPVSLRAEIDRTSILLQRKQAMIASVVNPIPASGKQRGHASIMPYLARSYSNDLAVEGILRPRMPVLMDAAAKGSLDLGTLEDEADDDTRRRDVVDQTATAKSAPLSHSAYSSASRLISEDTPHAHTMDEPSATGIKRQFEDQVEMMQSLISSVASPGKKLRTEPDMSGCLANSSLEMPLPSGAATYQAPKEDLRRSRTPPAILPTQPAATTSAKRAVTAPTIANPPTSGIQPVGEEEESDDEIPMLNIEPDTDDEDEDEMVE